MTLSKFLEYFFQQNCKIEVYLIVVRRNTFIDFLTHQAQAVKVIIIFTHGVRPSVTRRQAKELKQNALQAGVWWVTIEISWLSLSTRPIRSHYFTRGVCPSIILKISQNKTTFKWE